MMYNLSSLIIASLGNIYAIEVLLVRPGICFRPVFAFSIELTRGQKPA